jgi:hypothetical protein
MRKNYSYLLIYLALLISQLFSQVPQKMSYQGVLTDTDGNLVADGVYTMNFRMYTVAEGGKALWIEEQKVQITNGIFNVNLGEINQLDEKFERPYWLGISVNGAAEMTPRIELTSSAYSMNARSVSDSSVTASKIAKGAVGLDKMDTEGAIKGDIITFNGVEVDWQQPVEGGIGGSGTDSYIPRFSGANDLANSNIQYARDHGGNIGIGASPAGSDSKFIVAQMMTKGVTSPTNLASFQTKTPLGTTTNQATISRDGDAYIRGSLKIGSSNIKIAEIRELVGLTSASEANTYVYFPAGFNADNTRILSVELKSGEVWHSISGLYFQSLFYIINQTYIRIYQDTDIYTSLIYRIDMMRLE